MSGQSVQLVEIGLYARRIQPADGEWKEHYVKSMSQYRFTIPILEEKYIR